jgi:hypothetical protein
VGGGVQLGPLGTAATNRPIVPVPGDYDDGEIGGIMIGRGNRSTRRNPAPQTSHACPDANPGRRGGKPATNRLSYGTAWTMDKVRNPSNSDHFIQFYILYTLEVIQLIKL